MLINAGYADVTTFSNGVPLVTDCHARATRAVGSHAVG